MKEVLQISLPKSTYGLDVLAYIGWEHDRKYRQFTEIGEELREKGIEISDRHVSRLYNEYLALLGGLTEVRKAKLSEAEKEHGGLVWGLDGLKPDKNGPMLYVLYEVFSQMPVACAWLEKSNSEHLIEWLSPYGKLPYKVLATLSDGEPAEITAMKTVWSDAPHQMCQLHFLNNSAVPIAKADRELRCQMKAAFGSLPPIPGSEATAKAKPEIRTLELEDEVASSELEDLDHQMVALCERALTCLEEQTVPSEEVVSDNKPVMPVEAMKQAKNNLLALSQGQEQLFRKMFKDALQRPSRKPSKFGGLDGYDQLQGLVTAFEQNLPSEEKGYLHTLLKQGRKALNATAGSAQKVRQATQALKQVTQLLAQPLKNNANTSAKQVKQTLITKLNALSAQGGTVCQAFAYNTLRLIQKWGDDIFQCYDIEGLPPSNTALEARFNTLRKAHRRRSGKKNTSELRRTAHLEILLQADTVEELYQQLVSVPLSLYQIARQRLETAQEQQRLLYRCRRNPAQTALALLEKYLEIQKKLKLIELFLP
ncbi:hypothetical protein QUF63_00960 [Anaerolineales bacterium HSG25]|nr:hypothetical protein [Anaerolineales bacterium HSG25]